MNTNDGDSSQDSSRYFRWFAHPLTTLTVLLAATLVSAFTFGPAFAITIFSGSAAMITQLSDAYRTPDL